MSHMVTRKGPVGEDRDKRQTDSPVKEMKKKIAANAEKEKLAAEKNAEKSNDKQAEKAPERIADKKDKTTEKHRDKSSERKDKSADKIADKKDKNVEKNVEKQAEKKDKSAEKATEKKDKNVEKTTEKKDKSAEKNVEKIQDKRDKSTEKIADKKDKTDKKEPAENSKDAEGSSTEKIAKADKEEERPRKPDTAKHNGAARTQNGGEVNGTVSESDDDELIIVEPENDEMFPELTYDDNSDLDGFEPETPSRSLTRRSQVKVTRTPETPRPASDKQADKESDDSKEPKLLKLKEDVTNTDRRLRSASSPKPSDKKSQENESSKAADAPNTGKVLEPHKEEEKSGAEDNQDKANEKSERELEVTIEVESSEDGEGPRRDTAYSRSRVKVSPYRRSARAADITTSSTSANYTGNNTTMEMDITESSIVAEEPSPMEGGYLSALRSIRGRRSYKPLKQMALRNISLSTSHHSLNSVTGIRPTGTVVGRKRRPDADASLRGDAGELVEGEVSERRGTKRPRLLDRLARPFRTHTPLPARRAAEIVGINTDLPQSAPVAAAVPFDPETIKAIPNPTPAPTPTLPPAAATERDSSKRCVVM